ncbi:MAG: FxLYD domain-containing protein, partial [Clostridia bacterium]
MIKNNVVNKENKDKKYKKINNKLRKIILIISVIIILILTILLITLNLKDKKSIKIVEEKTIDNLQINDAKIIKNNNEYIFTSEIKNNTNNELGNYSVIINLLDQNDNYITSIDGYINKIKPKSKNKLEIKTKENIDIAYDFVIEKK